MPAPPRSDSSTKSVVPVRAQTSRKPSSITTEPSTVYRMNVVAARTRPCPPQTAMTKYIGASTTSKNTKNSNRSWARNVPSSPTSSSSRSPTSARGRPGSGRCRTVYAAHNAVSSVVSTTSGSEIPSTPRWNRSPSCGTQAVSITPCRRRGSARSKPAASATDTASAAAVTTTPNRCAHASAR